MRQLVLSLAAMLTLFGGSNLQQSIDLGFTNTTGNSKTTNVNGKYGLLYKTTGYNSQPLDLKFSLSAFYAENDDVKSNEEYTSSLSLEQFIYNGWLGYFTFDWLRNPDFKNYDGKYEFGLGAGKEVYKDERSSLKLKLGVGYNVLDFADETSTDTFASLLQQIDYTNKLNELSLLYGSIRANEGFEDWGDNYEIKGTLGLKFNLTNSVHAVLEEQVTYDNLPPAGFKKTDTKTIVRLGVTF
ncbi:MAG: DUF481 domain-containing protein [Epsilonproteobacteria bacterium]|nr:hypothetical protein [Campylobacterota bacterium]NPA56981.1 DUF481 domain-containing protein [Campylobacterota bacterium]